MSSTVLSVSTLGPQLVILFGDAWDVWPGWGLYVTRGRLHEFKAYSQFILSVFMLVALDVRSQLAAPCLPTCLLLLVCP